MKNKYLLLLPLVALLAGSAQAQTLGYTTDLAVTRPGTYVDLGASGTVIATATTDYANSAAQSIGFPFLFDGTTYSQFVLNTNGFIKLGTTAPPAASFQPYAQQGAGGPVDDATLTDLLLPFNTDLTSSTAAPAEYRVLTTGTAPNRVCTIQWKNVADKARPATPVPAPRWYPRSWLRSRSSCSCSRWTATWPSCTGRPRPAARPAPTSPPRRA